MPATPPVSSILTRLAVPHRVFRHAGPVNCLEQAAAERGQQPEQIVRSILFRIGKEAYAMVLMAGPDQISWRALRRRLGQSRLTMAKRDEVLAVTGYEIGAVSPFGLPIPLPILVDRSVLAADEISIGSGVRGTTIILGSQDLLQALGQVDVGDFHSDPDEPNT